MAQKFVGHADPYFRIHTLSTGDSFLADSTPTEPPPLETRISSMLWQWRFADPVEREAFNWRELGLLLEFWMPFSQIEFTRKKGIWCDGVFSLSLSIFDLSRTAFTVKGCGYFPNHLALFWIDFLYRQRRDLATETISFRWGYTGTRDRRTDNDPDQLLALCPDELYHWPVAVELTPLVEDTTG